MQKEAVGMKGESIVKKRVILTLLATIVVACALCAQTLAASSATRQWELGVTQGISVGTGTVTGQPAVDAAGNIYVVAQTMVSGAAKNVIRKIDWQGNMSPTYIGPNILRFDGYTAAVSVSAKANLACDPLTGYIYMRTGGGQQINVIDPNANGGTGLVVRQFNDGIADTTDMQTSWHMGFGFSPDGSKFYSIAEKKNAHATDNYRIIREIPRAESRYIQATLSTGTAGTNRILWTASQTFPGTAGNALTVALVATPNTPTLTLAQSGTGATGTIINLATDAAGNSLSTVADVITAIHGNPPCYSRVVPTSSDTGIVTPTVATLLTGGGGDTLAPPASDGNYANDVFDVNLGYMDYGCAAAKAAFNGATPTVTNYGSLNNGPLRYQELDREWLSTAVDDRGGIYIGANSDVRYNKRFVSGHPEDGPDMQFTTPYWHCASMCTDENNRLWTVDVPYNTADTNRFVRCWKDGGELLRFDPTVGSTTNTKGPANVAYDRAHDRVIVWGISPFTGTRTGLWLSSWSATIDQPGTISGVVTNATTGAPIPNAWVVAWPYDRWNWNTQAGTDSMLRPVAVRTDANGAYTLSKSAEAPYAQTWTLVADTANYKSQVWATTPTQDPTYYGTQMHWDPMTGTSVTGDLPLLVKADTDHVTCDMSTNPSLEQGVFLKDCPLVSSTGASWNGDTKFATVGGRGCRSIGTQFPPNNSWPYMAMQFDIATGFIPWNSANPYAGVPVVVEADVFDGGYDRYFLQLETVRAPDATLDYPYKSNTGTWQTKTWYRPDGKCNGGLKMGGSPTGPAVPTAPAADNSVDFRFITTLTDASAPVGADYISKVVVRNATNPTIYQELGSIKDLKALSVGQSYTWTGGQYGGGIAVKLTDKAVTAAWNENGKYIFYIEETDRSSGIRVVADQSVPTLSPGDVVTITGLLTGVPETQELAINADSVVVTPGASIHIAPFAMSSNAVGGDALTVVRNIDGSTYKIVTQPGTGVGRGPANIGMLVTVYGKVKLMEASDLYLDDGTNKPRVGTQIGVKASFDWLYETPSVGDYISAVGVVTMGLYDPTPANLTNGDEVRYPVVVIQSPDAVKKY